MFRRVWYHVSGWGGGRSEHRSSNDGLDALYGWHSVSGALAARRRDLSRARLLVRDGTSNAEQAVKAAASAGVPVESVGAGALERAAGPDAVHQGVVLLAGQLPLIDVSPEARGELVHLASALQAHASGPVAALALDRVVDPHNVGSLVRTAAFLGVSVLLLPDKETAPLSPVVSHVSTGALESMAVFRLSAFVRTLTVLQSDHSAELVVSTLADDSVDVATHHAAPGSILVLGSEAKGVRAPLASAAAARVRIVPQPGAHGTHVQSLNVGVAGGILLHTLQSL
ncbi:RNA methyltransferase [Thecamonas trahens ATCC 50062]|uniref:rRNA methyltransferase 1, mitochondrial n=1 Tax=Thecamonas trahens ATCC 50062 TaxID=461836 RepID=A0A0L0DDT3_THETB|nr:RNA methyltransferase [Thecamonas trahens ATCC 50062]KNC50380.1 RNA methyltransferase [Thecamonas trahens ATCC 50062]|eukprot:XP_013756922.1 RNA methyltransferase [Thecamonas trahens ATCC 50062]